MTQAQQINEWKAAAILGFIPDNENPLFLFSSATKEMLVDILSEAIDAKELARFELKCRGLNEQGKFIGFN